MLSLIAAKDSSSGGVDLDIASWHWPVLLTILAILLLIDILVIHREAHVVHTREAAIESAVWISVGLLFSLFILWEFGGAATGEYLGGYLIEKSLSVDNVFVWAIIFSHFRVPPQYQHRVLFWGIFGALAMRLGFVTRSFADH